jgi:carboxylesterase 1
MYEFQYSPSFSSEMKPDTVVGDHGDEIYSVFGAPILRGNGALLPVSLRFGALRSKASVALSISLLLS